MNKQQTFEVKDKIAFVTPCTFFSQVFYSVRVHSKKTHEQLAVFELISVDNVRSFTALMRACKDSNNQHKPFCPQTVSCSASGGDLSPPVATSQPTATGNLFFIKIKNNSIKYIRSGGAVLAIVHYMGDKYTYHLPIEAYHKIKRIHDDCVALHGYPIGIKRHIALFKKLSYDKKNERYAVA